MKLTPRTFSGTEISSRSPITFLAYLIVIMMKKGRSCLFTWSMCILSGLRGLHHMASQLTIGKI